MNRYKIPQGVKLALWCSATLLGIQTVVSAATLANRYSFNETGGTTAADAVGAKNGTLMNNAFFTGSGSVYLGSFGVLSSDPGGDYIVLPEGMVSGLGL
jgi:hypothetical protein